MSIKLKPVQSIGEAPRDWWVIEREEHDGREWFEPYYIDGELVGQSFRTSARISDADVEGPSAEMLQIADAIERRSAFEAKRCAVEVYSDSAAGIKARLWSPRNSQEDGIITLADADYLARQIREQVK